MKPRVLLDSIGVGILLLLLISALSQTTGQVETYLQTAVRGKTFLGDAILFAVIFVVGFGGTLALMIRRRGQGEMGVGLANIIGVSLIDLANGLGLGRDLSIGTLALSALLVGTLVLRYATHFFSITAPMWEKPPYLRPASLVGLAAAGAALVGALLGRVWLSEHLTLGLLSVGSAFLLFGLIKLIHRSYDREARPSQIGGLAAGFFLALIIEAALAVLRA